MHPALEQFRTDLVTHAITHDGCPITAAHMANAVKRAAPGDRYVLAKPAGADHQKIDAAMAAVLAHRAAADARADGWALPQENFVYFI
jgi:phage terminase large subunit-like protein